MCIKFGGSTLGGGVLSDLGGRGGGRENLPILGGELLAG